MVLASTNISFYRGDYYPVIMTVKDNVTKNPVDLTGAVITLTVNAERDPINTDNELFSVVGEIADDATTGVVSFPILLVHTAIDPGAYFFDVSMARGTTYNRTIARGVYSIHMDTGK